MLGHSWLKAPGLKVRPTMSNPIWLTIYLTGCCVHALLALVSCGFYVKRRWNPQYGPWWKDANWAAIPLVIVLWPGLILVAVYHFYKESFF